MGPTATGPTARVSSAWLAAGHDGRAEVLVELTYANGGTANIALDHEALAAILDTQNIHSLDELVGQPIDILLPALASGGNHARPRPA